MGIALKHICHADRSVYYRGMQEGNDDEDSLSNSYTTAEIKCVEKSMVSGKESHKYYNN